MQDKSWLSRTELLVGAEALDTLANSHVMIIGMGGVGSFAAEFVCRGGVGKMTIVDGDTVDPTNRNRQLPALSTNHGESKVQVMAERLKAINPELELTVVDAFVTPDKVKELLDTNPDYVIDAIDSITPKLTFIKEAYFRGIRYVSSMGAGGKVDPTKMKVADISQTYNCPFAQYIRKRLRKEKIRKGITVAFSTEVVNRDSLIMTDGSNFKRSAYGTSSYIPATFGATVASVCLRELMGMKVKKEKSVYTENHI